MSVHYSLTEIHLQELWIKQMSESSSLKAHEWCDIMAENQTVFLSLEINDQCSSSAMEDIWYCLK